MIRASECMMKHLYKCCVRRLSALHPPERHGASGWLTVLKIHNGNNLRGRGEILMKVCDLLSFTAPRLLWFTKTNIISKAKKAIMK